MLSLRGPSPVPSLFTGSDAPAFHWGDDILFDDRRGKIDPDAGFEKALSIVWEGVVQGVLFQKCGFAARDVCFLGYGQGGMLALAIAASRPECEFAGVLSIGGRLPSSAGTSRTAAGKEGKSRTPVLVLGGSRSTQVTRSAIDELRARFRDVEYVKWTKGEDSMPQNREEMVPLMRFWARRLRSRAGVPEGAVEVG